MQDRGDGGKFGLAPPGFARGRVRVGSARVAGLRQWLRGIERRDEGVAAEQAGQCVHGADGILARR